MTNNMKNAQGRLLLTNSHIAHTRHIATDLQLRACINSYEGCARA